MLQPCKFHTLLIIDKKKWKDVIKSPFNVESALELSRSLESADHVTMYTACTCPLSVIMNLPVAESHSFTDLSNDADAIILSSIVESE